jgi:MFS family permease
VGGVVAALAPPTIAVVGWSGLATLLALVFAVPLIGVAAYLPHAVGRERVAAFGSVVLLAAATVITQPLIGQLVVGALVAAGLASILLGWFSWRVGALVVAGLALVCGPLLLAYKDRLDSLGGLQGANAYLPTRIDWVGVTGTGMLPVVLVVGALGGLAVASYGKSSRPLAVAVLTVIAAALLYSQSWRIGVAGEYRRAIYLIGPLAAVGVAGLATDGLGRGQARNVSPLVSVVAVVLLAAAGSGWPQQQSDFFQVATQANWVVAQKVGRSVRPEEAIVADPCWAFPAVGLGSARVFGALLPHQIGPVSESVPAAQSRAVFAGGRAGRSAAASLGIRWSFVDPSCPTPLRMGKQDGVPPGFIPVAVDDHLIVGYRP